MRTRTLVKLPFRLARAVWRAVRDELHTSLHGRPRATAQPAVAPPARPAVAAQPPVSAPPAPPPPAPPPPLEVRVEETPNPDALKFVCSRQLLREGSLALNDAENARGVPFAEAIFALDGIRTVFATKDFVTVTRRAEAPGWEVLRPAIVEALKAHGGR